MWWFYYTRELVVACSVLFLVAITLFNTAYEAVANEAVRPPKPEVMMGTAILCNSIADLESFNDLLIHDVPVEDALKSINKPTTTCALLTFVAVHNRVVKKNIRTLGGYGDVWEFEVIGYIIGQSQVLLKESSKQYTMQPATDVEV